MVLAQRWKPDNLFFLSWNLLELLFLHAVDAGIEADEYPWPLAYFSASEAVTGPAVLACAGPLTSSPGHRPKFI